MKKKSEYLAYTSVGYKTGNILACILIAVAGFLGNYYMGTASIIFISAATPSIIAFLDFFAFACISTRNQHTMNFIKSSYYGRSMIQKALKTDIFFKIVLILISYVGFLLSDLILCTVNSELFLTVHLILLEVPVCGIIIALTVIISRHIAATHLSQMGICYAMLILQTALTVTITLVLPDDITVISIPIVVTSVIASIICVVLWIVLYKDSLKGYDSSFYDN